MKQVFLWSCVGMNKKDKKESVKIEPGVHVSSTASSLKLIANKSVEAYSNKRPEKTEADQKRKNAEAEMAASTFRAQPFVSPISGRKKPNGLKVMIAHGIYDLATGKVIGTNEPVLLTEEAMKAATFTLTSDISKILASHSDDDLHQTPIQGRLVFSTLEGEFEIDANLVRVKLEDSDVYAQYDRTLDDVLKEQFGRYKGPKPFTRIIQTDVSHQTGMTSDIKKVTMSTEDQIQHLSEVDSILPTEEVILMKESASFEPDVNEHDHLNEDVQIFKPEMQTITPSAQTETKEQNFYYKHPALELLEEGQVCGYGSDEWIQEKMSLLEQTFVNFGVAVTVTGNYVQGATVTQFEIAPDPGTKVGRIKGLADDLKLSLSVTDLRIEAIPGKNTIGIEIANDERRLVRLKEILSSPQFVLHESPLFIGLGEDLTGEAVYADIASMPHGLVAGQTGSGKSVCINTLLVSILYKSTPETVRLMLIDPKRVEMAPYNDIPHLVTPVINDEKKAATALAWAVDEMERRYDLFARNGVRDIKTFNKKRKEFEAAHEQIPYILIVIDELADLMMVAAQDVEDAIIRLTQKARSAGIHLIVATQRPTVNVITGTIKSNIPTRIAFAVAQANDSRVIIDSNGAEDLLGRGDMLIAEGGNKVRRVQGAFVSDEEVARVVAFVKLQGEPNYLIAEDALDKRIEFNENSDDPMERAAIELFIEEDKASVSLLQRKLSMGYNRAAKMVDQLEEKGFITKPIGATSKRDVLLTKEELLELYEESLGGIGE